MISRAPRGVGLLVFCSALALYLLTAGGSLTSTDAVVTFDLTSSLVERHSIALSGNVLGLDANRGVDGRYYSQYGIGQSIYNIPFYLAGKAAAHLLPRRIGKPDTLPKAAVALGSAVAAAFAIVLVWSLARRLGTSPHAALIAALTAAIASPLWPYSKFGFSTALTTAILLGAARLVAEARMRDDARYAAGAGAVLAFGWLTRHEMALALLPFCAALLIGARESHSRVPMRHVAALVGVTAVGGVLWAWYNVARFGSPMSVGYSPLLDGSGYAAFLIAPAGSILLFAPIAIVWAAGLASVRFAASARVLLAGPLLTFYAFYGALADWPGGRSYGPRYLVPSLVLLAPGAAALWDAGRPRRRKVLAIACVIGAVLQLPGVLVDYAKVSTDWARAQSREAVAERNWHLSSSPLVLGTEAAVRAVPANVAYLTGARQPPRVAATSTAEDRDFAQQLSFSLDFWWLYLVYLHAIRPAAAALFAMVLLSVALAAARRAWTAG
ncbi:MAG TPA: glycosyltransferase family 39 protein [Vicinamibacterales bacterium]|nr:glycosyltransferase family 39 protein [Vicinamibacterales bacterium]